MTIPIITSLCVPSKTNRHLIELKIPKLSRYWPNCWSYLDVPYSSELHPAFPTHISITGHETLIDQGLCLNYSYRPYIIAKNPTAVNDWVMTILIL